jgi:hypothetical protein
MVINRRIIPLCYLGFVLAGIPVYYLTQKNRNGIQMPKVLRMLLVRWVLIDH